MFIRVEESMTPLAIVRPRDLSPEDQVEYDRIEGEVGDDSMEYMNSALAAYTLAQFKFNEDARDNSTVEDSILQDLRMLNGEYDPEDRARIKGGSSIYMNIGATKMRAAFSWIKDLLLNPKGKPWSLSPTALPELPADMVMQIEQGMAKEFERILKTPPKEGEAPKEAAETIKQVNEKKRDFYNAVVEELDKEASFALVKMEKLIEDQLGKGDWDDALSTFIEDFCTAPVAIMKSTPAVRKVQTYIDGIPTVKEEIIIKNMRVSPLDMYPSPEATDINDGFLCEHIRLSYKEVSNLKSFPGYNSEIIDEVLAMGPSTNWIVDEGVEDEKAELELRGDKTDVDKMTFHGLHCFGTIPTQDLVDWGLDNACLCNEAGEMPDYIEAEIVLINNEVVKASENKDPLGRKPYYKASYQNIPGSWWGRSLPSLMRDIQRMCNACARALANNMGYSSGPIMGLNIDRLADDGDITMLMPLDIVQFTNDPTGNSGRPIEFFQIPSIANELLAVYNQFEQKADDATGIPRYAYGNEKVGGAAQTSSGLAMLLDAASKTIKDAVRHIDKGLIVPRIERQFYFNLLQNPDTNFTGDVEVVALGSSTLTVKGAEQMKRNEFLQITSNPIDQKLMGITGRATLLREIAKDLGLNESVIPSRMELKKMEQEEKERGMKMQAMELEKEKTKQSTSLQATGLQTGAQTEMNLRSSEIKAAELEQRKIEHQEKMQVKVAEVQQRGDIEAAKNVSNLKSTEVKETGADQRQAREVALTMSGNKKTSGI